MPLKYILSLLSFSSFRAVTAPKELDEHIYNTVDESAYEVIEMDNQGECWASIHQ